MMGVQELGGLWTRSLIAWPDGRLDTATSVAWLQGPSAFADLRQPPHAADAYSGAANLAGLTMGDCMLLARQQGFAGRLVRRAADFEWQRMIDMQPRTAARDIGTLAWQGDVLVEEGVETAYTEHWHRDATPHGPAAAWFLRGVEDGRLASLIRAGDWFMFARDRAVPAPGADLAQAVAGAATLAAAQALVDCEISLGHITRHVWRIRRSSLPYRVGAAFSLQEGRWEITEAEGDIAALATPSEAMV
jgi:hypothetical protein